MNELLFHKMEKSFPVNDLPEGIVEAEAELPVHEPVRGYSA